MTANTPPREGMMAIVRNRRAMISSVTPHDADEHGRFHLVEVEYTDGLGAETDRLLWEVEADTHLIEPSALPQVDAQGPMLPHEFDALVRAIRWSALTPTLPFSGQEEDQPPIAAPFYGAVQTEDYQLVPLIRALQMPRVTLMLADAVGLGKTIQAGLILRELILRRRIRRVLILCPASLRTQWREELEEKFSLPFQVVDRPHHLKLQRELGLQASPWRTHERIITSYHYLKQADVLEQLRSVAQPGEDGRLQWDLLIVDEAHNLAPANFGDDSDLAKMLRQISPWFEHRLFLTATPHNGHTRCFSGLLEALDPVRFTRKSELTTTDRQRVGEAVIRRLKSHINASYTPARFSERHISGVTLAPLARNERHLHSAFDDLRRAIRASAGKASPTDRVASGFALEVLHKRMLSGPWAFGQSWLNLISGMTGDERVSANSIRRARDAEEQDDENDNERHSRQVHTARTVGAWMRSFQEAAASEIKALTDALRACGVQNDASRPERVTDARFDALVQLIDSKLRHDGTWRSDERIVIFTEYLDTLDYLKQRLEQHYSLTPDSGVLEHLIGGMRDQERDTIKQAFNDAASPTRILLATDAAGEGLNMQRACRYLLHWDIPWNPGRMEQRNGRLDRHGQMRDVTIFHFDSQDDASLNFLGKLLRKRSQTREDRIATDDLFSTAILAYFGENDGNAAEVERRLDGAIRSSSGNEDDIPDGEARPGQRDRERLDQLRAQVDLSPETLRETLETAMALEAGRPRLAPDPRGRHRLVPPVPALWGELIDETLRLAAEKGAARGSIPALVFDPQHYIRVQPQSGRPVYVPEPDSRLMHLGHALYHRVQSTFARFRFPGAANAPSRWLVRSGGVPEGMDALVLLTFEEFAVNELREPCHHWVRTLRYPVIDGDLGEPLPELPAAELPHGETLGDVEDAREIWDDLEDDLRRAVRALEKSLTSDLQARLERAGAAVKGMETRRFDNRKRQLERAMQDNSLNVLREEASKLREQTRQKNLFTELDQELERKLSDLGAEMALRQSHYQGVLDWLEKERDRTLRKILPFRYKLRDSARVYPLTVEIRLPETAR